MRQSAEAQQQREGAREGAGRTISSAELLGGARELTIEHGGERYRLLLTRSNKLILTK